MSLSRSLYPMYDRTIVRAAIMALTAQNVSPRPAPSSTTLMQGKVINASLRTGDTVCCYYYDSGELLRVGNVPTHDGSFSIDSNNLMYDLHNGYVRVRNGLSGEVVENEVTEAYEFQVLSGGGACAYKISRNNEVWRFYWPDGHYTEDSFPGLTRYAGHGPVFGFRNGLISVCGWISHHEIAGYILTPAGRKTTLAGITGGTSADYTPYMCCPVNDVALIIYWQSTGMWSSYTFMSRMTVEETQGLPTMLTENITQLGTDQAYWYGIKSFPEDERELYWLTRWSIDEYDGLEVVQQYRDAEPHFYGPPTPMGSIAANVDGTVRLYNITTQQVLYPEVLTSVPATSVIRENADYLWINGQGVYNKTASGWLMYPTAVYPRAEPWGRLGYALRNAALGTQGVAAVLFE